MTTTQACQVVGHRIIAADEELLRLGTALQLGLGAEVPPKGGRARDTSEIVGAVAGLTDTVPLGRRLRVSPRICYHGFGFVNHSPSYYRANGSRISAGESMDFDDFWKVYPLHIGKIAARKAWAKALKIDPGSAIIEGAVRYASDPNREPGFTAHPTTWLNQGRWDDDPLPPRLNGNGKRPEPANVRMGANGAPERFSPGSGWIQDSAVS